MENKEDWTRMKVTETLHIPGFKKLLAEAPEPSEELLGSVAEYQEMKVTGKDNTFEINLED